MPPRLALVLLLLLPGPAAAQEPGAVRGRVVDREAGAPVADAEVELAGTGIRGVTDGEGRFLLREVPPGRHLLVVRHLAYGVQGDSVSVAPGRVTGVQVRISPTAIALEPVIVEVMSARERERRARGTRANVVTREQIEAVAGSARHIGHVLDTYIPNVSIREHPGLPGRGICVEFRHPRSILDALQCKMPAVFVDHVRVADAGHLLEDFPLQDVERIELLPPSEAGARYGTGSRYGVLLIETRSGYRPSEADSAEVPFRAFPAYDWSREEEGHPWLESFLGAAAGNLLGLGVAAVVAGECLSLDELSRDLRSTRCGGPGTALARISALALPALGAGVGARIFGATRGSAGRPLPAAVAAAAVLVPGLAFVITSRQSGFRWAGALGGAMVFVGAPAAAALADHLFRRPAPRAPGRAAPPR